MFERYTEKALRTIYFARYEAIQFGCSQIDTEQLLLGVFREDKALASQHSKLEGVRHSIAKRGNTGLKIAIPVDPPFSQESKRVPAYAAEESQDVHGRHHQSVFRSGPTFRTRPEE